jgi:hypothetical protein
LAYAVTTSQWGFLLTTGVSIGINVRNFIHHQREE